MDNILSLISQEDRVKNLFLYGQPKDGRDDLLISFLKSDIENGLGLTLVDSSGDIIKIIKDSVPQDKLVLFDPSDPANHWRLDYFDHTLENERAASLAINNLAIIFQSTLVKNGNYSVHDLKSFYQAALNVWRLPDPSLVKLIDFLGEHEKKELEPLITKSFGKNVFDPKKKKLNLLTIMQNNQCLLCDLSKAKLGDENTIFYGLLMVQMFYQAGCARYNLPLNKRVVHQLYINGFENLANKAIFTLLFSENRPLGVNVHLASSTVHNFDDDMIGSIFGNFGNLICFKANKADAEILAKNIGLFTPSDFENLNVDEAIVRVVSHGMITKPQKVMINYGGISLKPNIELIVNYGSRFVLEKGKKYKFPDFTLEYIGDYQDPVPENFSNKKSGLFRGKRLLVESGMMKKEIKEVCGSGIRTPTYFDFGDKSYSIGYAVDKEEGLQRYIVEGKLPAWAGQLDESKDAS